MTKVSKMNILIGLFFVLLVILVLNPRIIRNLYSSIIGRAVLILIVLFFSMNNITLGLLTALVVIVASNMFLFEGLDNMDTTSTSTPLTTNDIEKDKAHKTVDTKPDEPANGVDLETIKNSIQPKSSNSLPATTTTTTEEPSPSSKEAFRSMYASV